jgi:hypothetical protein
MPPRNALADFQASLLELLASDLPVNEIQERLQADAAFADFREYVVQLEPRMLSVAVELTKKWAKRSGSESVRHGME